jgi:hypothetical protein
MWRRIRIYLIGVSLGCILAWALLIRDRSDNTFNFWLPEERILTEIREDSNFVFPEKQMCYYECYGFNSIDLEYFLTNADVDFAKSKPRETPRLYFITGEIEQKGQLTLEVLFSDSAKWVHSVTSDSQANKTCNCE